jgi:NADH:ubiquinone reductase (H+-translocating)
MKKRVLILGGGYGGIFAGANLSIENSFDITIVDKNPYHQLLQQIHYLVSRLKEPKEITVDLATLFGNGEKGISILNAMVASIDLNERAVKVKRVEGAEETLGYDYVIIALGAETQYFGIEGAQQYCLPFRSVEDALRIREGIEALSSRSAVVIVGGGPTGVSLAAALLEMPAVKNNIKIIIVDSSEKLLPGWDRRLSATAEKTLVARGAEIQGGKKIVKVAPHSVTFDSGEQCLSNFTIWTAGVKGQSLQTHPQVERTKSGRILVDRYSRITGFEDAFALGDISEFTLVDSEGHKKTSPQLAQFAVRQARFVAKVISKKERGMQPEETFNFSQRGHTIALGKNSVGLLGGLLVTGRMCDYTEDSIVDNLVTEVSSRHHGISARASAAECEMKKSPDRNTEYPEAFDFITYATSRGFTDLVP